MKNNHNWKHHVVVVLYFVFIILLLFILKKCFPNVNIETRITSLYDFLGGTIGGIGTVFAMYVTIDNMSSTKKLDEQSRKKELNLETRKELVDNIAELIGKYITYISNYYHALSELNELNNQIKTLSDTYKSKKEEYSRIEEKVILNASVPQIDILIIEMSMLEKELQEIDDEHKSLEKQFYNCSGNSGHLEANEAMFIITAKLSDIPEANKLINYLTVVQDDVTKTTDPEWQKKISSKIIETYNEFKYEYLESQYI